MRRRTFLAALPLSLRAADAPVRAITVGPKHHWFGYYDKLQFDPTSRYALGMEVDFEHRSPRPEDEITLGWVDLADQDRWRPLATTRAWNWQQGAMLQWVPGQLKVMWNDRVRDRFVSKVFDGRSEKIDEIPHPFYCLSPDGRWAVAPDFRRLNDCRPGYGYAGIPDPNASDPAPGNAGIWRLDLKTGASKLIFPFSEALKLKDSINDWSGGKHWFNHLLFSPSGKRFIFLHRWRTPAMGQRFGTRMLTADIEGRNVRVVDPYGGTSHFIWRDDTHILAWAKHPSHGDKFYLYEDGTDKVEVVGKDVMTVNGHCTYLPGNRWILNDTYPDKERMQNLYLFEAATGRRVNLGRFHLPKEYAGEWRCDLHPRATPDGKQVCIDSAHAGGRQMYLVDFTQV